MNILGAVMLGMARQGMAWYGLVRHGEAGLG